MTALDEFISSLSEVRLKRSNQLFLCGGPITSGDSPHTFPRSARDFFLGHLSRHSAGLFRSVILAEDVAKNGGESKYGFNDLLDLERLLAEIVSVIVLFVESPGSLAELGAFSAIDSIRDRLIAVVENGYYEDNGSFIYLGPLRAIANKEEGRLLYLPWLVEKDNCRVDSEKAGEMAVTLLGAIEAFRNHTSSSKALPLPASRTDRLSNGEVMCLITGLLEIYQVLTKVEIRNAVRRFSSEVTDISINKYLYILTTLHLVASFEYSNQRWYHSAVSLVDWRFKEGRAPRTTLDWIRYIRDKDVAAMNVEMAFQKRVGARRQLIQRAPRSKNE